MNEYEIDEVVVNTIVSDHRQRTQPVQCVSVKPLSLSGRTEAEQESESFRKQHFSTQ